MQIPGTYVFIGVPLQHEEIPARLQQLITELSLEYEIISRLVNGNVDFGDGTEAVNIRGQWITFTSAGAGVENTIAHNSGAIPVGFIIMVPPASGTVNKGVTPWDSSNIYLTCSAATQTVTIFLVHPPQSET